MEMKNMRSISICILLQKFYQNICNSQRNVIFTCKTFFVPPKIYAFNFSGGKVLLSLAKRSPWETLHLLENVCAPPRNLIPVRNFAFVDKTFAFLQDILSLLMEVLHSCENLHFTAKLFAFLWETLDTYPRLG